tara:strand:+ start:542 stop:682 length:141 start_codon:yes stop_codon:yes gene_type:complete
MKLNIYSKMMLSLLALVGLLLTGCNTIDGMGEDIEKGGEHIQEAAE